ncbi:MAG: acyl-CoA synthetase [Myxococcales bacterium]|nr:acyl-CoA synthetase [Myxococcales bacterium]
MTSPLLEQIEKQLVGGGDRVAFRLGDQVLSWRELDRRAEALLEGHQGAGLLPGDRVASRMEASLSLPVAILAHLRGGFIHVPIAPGLRGSGLEHWLGLTQPKVILDSGDWGVENDRAGPPVPMVSDPAWILSTSGTTAAPKGVLHSHRSLLAGIGALTALWDWGPADHQILALPLFHVHGLGIGVLGAMLRGVETTLLPRFDAESLCQAMTRHSATIFMGVPTMYHRLIAYLEKHPEAAAGFRAARLCTAGSAALGPDRLAAFEALTGQRILERYGMSETLITVSNPYAGERREGSIGKPLSGVEHRLVDGELQVRGQCLMAGYWQDTAATQRAWSTDGWFLTGDQVEEDDEGYLYHRGRRSIDWIKSGGWRIGTVQLEEVLCAHPQVKEAAVVGLPDEEWGELVAAAVVPQDETGLMLSDLAKHVAAQLPAYQQMRRWLLLSALPRNAMGKVQKAKLASWEHDWQQLK